MLGAFSREDFDVNDWVNKVLEDVPDDTSFDSHISAVSMKLQILSADLNDDLERSMTDLVAALPRACTEADRGEGLSEALAKHLQRIEVRLNAIEASTSDQVLVLEHLDVLKRNMERCGETLTEAANWSALVRECHASFANQQLRKVATELEALRKSERVLRNVPGGSERTKTLSHLSEQLEKLLRPELISLLSKSHRVLDLIQMAEMYGRLGKMGLLKEEYITARPAALHRLWFSYGVHDTLKQWLPEFHEQVISSLIEERRRCIEIFSDDGPSVACGVATAVFEPIVASFAQRLADHFDLPACTDCYLQTLDFINKAVHHLSGTEEEATCTLMKACVAPFVEFQRRLGALEQEHLQNQLQEMTLSVQDVDELQEEALVKLIDSTQESIPLVISEAKQAVQRSLRFCGGVRSVDTCDALKIFFSSIVKKFVEVVEAVRHISGVEVRSKNQLKKDMTTEEPSFEWRFLHSALRMLSVAGCWLRALMEFEAHAVQSLKPLYALLFPSIASLNSLDYTESNNPSEILDAFKSIDSSDHLEIQNLALTLNRQSMEDGQSKELRALLLSIPQSSLPNHSLKSLTPSIFSGSLLVYSLRESLQFCSTARELVFDVTMRNIRSSLNTISKLDLWCGKSSPAYSIQPSAHVTKVGEHLLSLYQELEIFARDETARNDATCDLSSLVAADWRKLSTLLPLNDSETSALLELASSRFIPGIALDGEEQEEEEEEGEEEDAVALFCNEWLLVAVRSAYAVFIARMLDIPKVDDCGLSQLSADVDYLLNVTSALGLDRHGLMDHMSKVLKLSREEFSQALERKKPTSCSGIGGVVRKIETQLAGIRGIAVAFSTGS